MPRPKNTDLRRAEIVEAFQRVLAVRGYSGATIAEVSRAAGIPPGLVHYHFRDKEEMLLVLVSRFGRIVAQRYEARLARADGTPIGALFAYIDAHVAVGDDADPGAVAAWVAVGAEAVHQTAVRDIYREVMAARIAQLRRLFARCLHARQLRLKGLREMAAAVAAVIEGAFQIASAAPGLLPPGSAARTIRQMALGLIEAAGAS